MTVNKVTSSLGRVAGAASGLSVAATMAWPARLLPLWLACTALLPAANLAPQFAINAADFITAEFRSAVRLTGRVRDYGQLRVTARLGRALVGGAGGLARGGVTLELRPEGGSWAVVESPVQVRGGLHTWQVHHPAPCITHSLRLWVEDAGGQASLHLPDAVPGVMEEELVRTGFRPAAPSRLTAAGLEPGGPVRLSWTASPCAALYDLTYNAVTGEKAFSVQVRII